MAKTAPCPGTCRKTWRISPAHPGLRRRHGPHHLGQPALSAFALPGRTNIVVTRNPAWQAAGAIAAHSLPEALAEAARHSATVWVIGGAQIYAQALPLADAVEVTHIQHNFDGDAFAPTLGPEWHAVQHRDATSAQGWPLRFVRYERLRD